MNELDNIDYYLNQTPPDKLYYYCKNDYYVTDIFIRKVFYFKKPMQLNDPYECKPRILRSGKMNVKQFRKIFDNLKIFCTSEINNSVIMWSHYAESHMGLCIEIDTKKMMNTVKFWKIKYTEKLPVIEIGKKDSSYLTAFVKHEDWRYEEEWRMVLVDQPGTEKEQRINIDDGVITGIIMGEKMDSDNRQRVADWIDTLVNKPTLYLAKSNKKKYQMDIETYPKK